MMLTREHRSTRRMACVTSSITITIKTSLVLSPGLHGDGPGTNRLNHSMASPEFHFKNSGTAQPEYYFTDRNTYEYKLQKSRSSASTLLTWKPLQVHEPNFMMQLCSSNGKYSTLISQEDLQIAGGFQETFPSNVTIAFVIRVTSQFPSALQTNKQTPV